MIARMGKQLEAFFQKNMPDAFVFALGLTLITMAAALLWIGSSPIETLDAWYRGFWILLEFGMQMVLILVTGYAIALSPLVKRGIDALARYIRTPAQVYLFVLVVGMLLVLVSWGWLVITAVLARELAMRVRGIHYPFLIACVYFSGGTWVNGMSSTIPLLLNTEGNYLIEAEILSETIATGETLGSWLNIGYLLMLVLLSPLLFRLIVPKDVKDLPDLMDPGIAMVSITIRDEAKSMTLPFRALSDRLNNSSWLTFLMASLGLAYIVYYFGTRGMDLNLNIMIFVFISLGLLLHRTPIRYGIAMKRSCANISGIVFQYPFYAGIMGIMIFTGLGEELARLMASVATVDTFPLFAFLTGGMVNFAIPSAGGEFAVIGPSILEAVREIGAGLPETERVEMLARASLAVAYGESLTNSLQPFYLLIILPVMGAGIKIQARDVMGYLILPFLAFLILGAIMVTFMPI